MDADESKKSTTTKTRFTYDLSLYDRKPNIFYFDYIFHGYRIRFRISGATKIHSCGNFILFAENTYDEEKDMQKLCKKIFKKNKNNFKKNTGFHEVNHSCGFVYSNTLGLHSKVTCLHTYISEYNIWNIKIILGKQNKQLSYIYT